MTQPNSNFRLGEYLVSQLRNQGWTEFRAAIAFVKRSGTQHLAESLKEFGQRASVRVSVGIDLMGTSREGLEDLLHSVSHGEIWIFHNNNPSATFHPKLCLFKNDKQAITVIGSGNWTRGGLFTNYEASAAVLLNRTVPNDATALAAVEAVLDSWSYEQPGLCHRLTNELLEQIVQSGYVRSEAQVNAAAAALSHPQSALLSSGVEKADAPSLFSSVAVPVAPPVPAEVSVGNTFEPLETTAESLVTGMNVAAAAGLPAMVLGGHTRFVMTLQNTDVGIGQTTPGTTRRSPEVFIPLAALDANPVFWKFPESFAADTAWNADHPQYRRNGMGKLDRTAVPMRIGTLQLVNMFFNPQKKDFRLRHEVLRSSGHVGDILLVTALDPENGYEYDVQVAPQGTPLFDELLQYCTVAVLNSQKFFGYF